jgi:2-polyprenyl-6-methoxyphenol hydroxylase-like FAD-dependent oxidoreductase
LIRYGIDFVIIDKKDTTTPHSKAIGVQARTLEIYEQIGLADKLVDLGWKAQKARMVVGGEVRGEVDFSDIGKGLSDYPYVLIVEQGRHEKLIYDFITSNGKDVRWKTGLESFTQDDSGVPAKIKNPTAEIETIEAKYLVGCDGSKSPVRHSLGLTFEGITFERMFYVADVEIDWEFKNDALMVFLMKSNLLAFFQWSERTGGESSERFRKNFRRKKGKFSTKRSKSRSNVTPSLS